MERFVSLIAWIFCSGLAAAADFSDASAHLWSSSASVGFGVEEQSSTGFGRTGGSLFFLDVARDVADGLSFGLRTSGMGGVADGMSFHRMSAGPLMNWRFHEDWRVSGAIGIFKESAAGRDGDDVYASEGSSVLIGWERVVSIGRYAEFACGGFWAQHSGTLNRAAAISPAEKQRMNHVDRNEGQTRGIAMSLTMPLR